MAQAVSSRPFIAEVLVCDFIVHVGFVVDKVALGQVFSQLFGFPVNIILPWLSMFIYYLGDEQEARWWPQFKRLTPTPST
jgi:hypothetical protein